MKKEYVRAEMEIEYFETEDIITTSSPLRAKAKMSGGMETPLDRIDPNNSSDWTNLPGFNTNR